MVSEDTRITIDVDERVDDGIISVKLGIESDGKSPKKKIELFARNPTTVFRLETYEFQNELDKTQSMSSFHLPREFFMDNYYEIHYGNKLIRIPSSPQKTFSYERKTAIADTIKPRIESRYSVRPTLSTIIPVCLFALFLVLAQVSLIQRNNALSNAFMIADFVILVYLIVSFLKRRQKMRDILVAAE